ncbi:MAG TPA: hypothetical protein VEB21_19235 [Terriglobales bacterium]|nr:hypothetical protein [Terriglobales bacterium]
MQLTTAHRILITVAVVAFFFYAGVELQNYFAGDGGALLRSLLAAAGAIGLAIYLRRFLARLKQ